jgi:hypothetical protein
MKVPYITSVIPELSTLLAVENLENAAVGCAEYRIIVLGSPCI